jgi:hypothetical protein
MKANERKGRGLCVMCHPVRGHATRDAPWARFLLNRHVQIALGYLVYTSITKVDRGQDHPSYLLHTL